MGGHVILNSIFVNSEDPDETQHNVAFHQGLHCCKGKKSSDKRIQCFKIITRHP